LKGPGVLRSKGMHLTANFVEKIGGAQDNIHRHKKDDLRFVLDVESLDGWGDTSEAVNEIGYQVCKMQM
jgi:hypothetical protein